jgi:threonyl-tRNA synthetase
LGIELNGAHLPRAAELAKKLEGYRVEIDDSDETVGKRIRNAELDKIPYVIVWGDKESDEAIAIRERGGDQKNLPLPAFLEELATLSA